MFGFDMFGTDGNNIMNSMNVCPGCGRMLLPGEFSAGGLCQDCFESMGEEEDVRYCRFCGAELEYGSEHCFECDRDQSDLD